MKNVALGLVNAAIHHAPMRITREDVEYGMALVIQEVVQKHKGVYTQALVRDIEIELAHYQRRLIGLHIRG